MMSTPIAMPRAGPMGARLRAFVGLTKPRLNLMVLATTYTGYHLAAPAPELVRALFLLVGTGALAAGASALNMLIERERDARMLRTRSRPLPSGRVTPGETIVFGALLAAMGLVVLALLVHPLTSFIGALTFACYLFVYTPLKPRTPFNTLAGAVPGALPPVMGWTAARGELQPLALVLFAILFLWQLPHFLAIAWLYREDYTRAGFRMLPVIDSSGFLTASQILNASLALIVASLAPTLVGSAGPVYLGGALLLGVGLFAFGLAFMHWRTDRQALRLFLASLVYLPVLMLLMICDRAVL